MKRKTDQTGTDSKDKKGLLLLAGGMLLADAVFLLLAAMWHGLWWNELLTAAVMLLLPGGICLYQIKKAAPGRGKWMLGLHVLELAVILLSYETEGMLRPVLAAPVLLSVIAGREAGALALIFYSMVSAVVCADPSEILLLYLLAGMTGICLLGGKKKGRDYLIGGTGFFAVFIVGSLLLSFYAYNQIEKTDIIYGALGAVLQTAPIVVFLPFLMEGGIRLPGVTGLARAVALDFPPVQELQEREPVVLKHSRLVARLSAQAAAEIGADALLAEAGGIYHEIGAGLGEDCMQKSLQICKKYRLPASVQNIVREYDPDKKTPSSKEAAIVMLSDSIVNGLEQSRKRNLQGAADSGELIRRVFKLREDSGAFLLSGLSDKELVMLKEFYIRLLGKA